MFLKRINIHLCKFTRNRDSFKEIVRIIEQLLHLETTIGVFFKNDLIAVISNDEESNIWLSNIA
jgi:hypothetical protein